MAAVALTKIEPPDPNRTWFGQKAKPSQAKPKHSLTGASLEIFTDNELQEVEAIDTNQYQEDVNKKRLVRQERYKLKLPDYLRQKRPQNEAVEKSRAELIKQMHETTRAQQTMDVLELKSKYFNVGIYDDKSKPNSPDKKPSWYGQQDLKHASDINVVGLSDPANYTNNYNRDKYGRRSVTHQYSVIGDPLKTGMEFSSGDRSISANQKPSYTRARDPVWLPKEMYMKQCEVGAKLAIDLPPNIQHAFGSKICRAVLSDKEKVDSSLQYQKRLHDSFYRTRTEAKEDLTLPENNIDPVYDGLSHVVRQNIFPGYTTNHKSLCKSVYTDEVHQRRMKDPDKWRYQRDELSTWAEQNVLRERVKKAWDGYLAETLGASK